MSQYKVIQSGNEVEVYRYENPFFNDFNDLFAWSYTRPDLEKTPDERFRSSCARTKNRLRRLILCNIGKWGQPLILVTYTFKSDVRDLSVANRLFRNFTQRINRYFGFKLKYVSVPEFQDENRDGVVHYHVLYFNLPFLDDIKIMEKVWGQGMCKVEAVRKEDAMGAYVTKYLQKSFGDVRLFGKKCYTASKGLIKPIEKRVDNLVDLSLDFNRMISVKEVSYKVGLFGTVNYRKYKN